MDKTRFVRPLEDEPYAFFIRPRRFGKSCWLSLLEGYYGRHWAGEFETLFGGTDIARTPTAERHRYVVVRFNFSAFDDTLETLEERFGYYCHIRLQGALERNADLFPEERTRAHPLGARRRRQAQRTVQNMPVTTTFRSACSSTSTTTSPTPCSRIVARRRTSRSPMAAASTATSSPP